MRLPKRALELLVGGMRHASIHPDTDLNLDFRLPDRVWDFNLFLRKFGDPSNLTPRRPLNQFVNIDEYITVTMAAVIMEGLFIEKAACQLRYMDFSARFYCLSRESTECLVIVDLAGRDLSRHFGGTLDSYLEAGQELCLSFRPGPRFAWGSREQKMQDLAGNVPAKVALPPRSQRDDDKCELWLECAIADLCPEYIGRDSINIDIDMNNPSASYSSVPPKPVWLKLGDTTKAMRRAFNGVARLLPSRSSHDEPRDGYDSECDLSMPLAPSHLDPRGHIILDVLCGNGIPRYFELDLVAAIPNQESLRIAGLLPPDLRGPAQSLLSKIPCGISLITGAPGCGKSMKLGITAGLCILQGLRTLLTATQHKAIDACLDKVVKVLRTVGRAGIVVVRVYHHFDDIQACQRVVRDENWKTGVYRSHSNWNPTLSIAAWLAFLVRDGPNPLTGQPSEPIHRLSDAPCVGALRQAMSRCAIPGISGRQLAAEQRHRTTFMKQTMTLILDEAMLVAATPYAALNAELKPTTQHVKALLVDEAATMPEALLLQLVFPEQKVLAFAFDKKQLPAHSDSKSKYGNPRVNSLEDQYILSTADRLMMLSWPVDQQRQQVRMLPGMMDPARKTFYSDERIIDVSPPGQDHSIGRKVEEWYHYRVRARGPGPHFSYPPSGKYWPAFLNVTGTQCTVNKNTKSSCNEQMWAQVWPILRDTFLDPSSRFAIPPEKICFLVPYRAEAMNISDSLRAGGFFVRTQVSHVDRPGGVSIPDHPHDNEDDPAEPSTSTNVMGARVPYHRPGGPCVSTIDAFQGQDAELVIFITTVTEASGPKFLRNKHRLCVAMTRMRQALLVVGDQGVSTFRPRAIAGNQRGLGPADPWENSSKEFKEIWNWFAVNNRVI